MTDEPSPWTPIPGETPIDVSGLKVSGVTNRRELSVVEAANIRLAIVKYLSATPSKRKAPFTYDWCLRLHREMFGSVWEWAGKPRLTKLNLGSEPHLVQEQLKHLLGDADSWTGFGFGLLDQSVMLHHRAVQIHPFENGNGRWSRMMANIWLFRSGEQLVEWPDEVIGQESTIRTEYINALQTADNGDNAPLTALHARYIRSAGSN